MQQVDLGIEETPFEDISEFFFFYFHHIGLSWMTF